MFVTFAVIQVVICILLVVVILLQEGKKGMGAIFGGSSSSIFGARGAANVLTKVTSVLAILFMLNSVWMSYISSRDASVVDSVVEETSENVETKPVEQAPVEKKEEAAPVEKKEEAPVQEPAPAK
ncbi:MAG TPA: preprotein translocase subunit SecG [bacterium]|nr:preprotein translocase subunit SecG [bacterium]HPS29529.1 preprotein translocase subunit SecG [bacterium]